MTMHYHGTPITPVDRLYELAGRNFCVSFAHPADVVPLPPDRAVRHAR